MLGHTSWSIQNLHPIELTSLLMCTSLNCNR